MIDDSVLFPISFRVRLASLFLSMGCLLLLCSSGQAEEVRLVRFIPHWSPQAQFAGYFVAKDNGMYERHGLDVEILRGGPDNPASEALAKGEAEFASLFLSRALILRSQGVPVVNVGQIVQRSALMLVAKKSSGVLSPIDLRGRRISVWPEFSAQPLAFLRRLHLDVEVVPQGYSLNLFLMGGVDAASAMWYNEYHTILNSGLDESELTTFLLADYGLNFPEDGLYCLENLALNDPTLVRAFVQASLEGWRYAFDHPEEALDAVMERVRQANLPTNRVHQKWMLDRMRDVILPPESDKPMGLLEMDEYEFVATELFESGSITDITAHRIFYDPRPSID